RHGHVRGHVDRRGRVGAGDLLGRDVRDAERQRGEKVAERYAGLLESGETGSPESVEEVRSLGRARVVGHRGDGLAVDGGQRGLGRAGWVARRRGAAAGDDEEGGGTEQDPPRAQDHLDLPSRVVQITLSLAAVNGNGPNR